MNSDGFIAFILRDSWVWAKEHILRLHKWENIQTLGSPDTGVLTRQECRYCWPRRTRITKLREDC